jgi:hypothetical protein
LMFYIVMAMYRTNQIPKKPPADGTTCPKHVGAKQMNKEDVIMCNFWFIIINTSVHDKKNIYYTTGSLFIRK